jgi:putative tryptophan/tyrosine transport system permease protein
MTVAVELGLIYAIMALGVYLTFRILNFPDLTVDGSFTTGAAVASIMIINGAPA